MPPESWLAERTRAIEISGIRKVFERFLVFGEGPSDAIMLDNDERLSGLQ